MTSSADTSAEENRLDIWTGLLIAAAAGIAFFAGRFTKKKETAETGEPPSKREHATLLAELTGGSHEHADYLPLLDNRTATEVMVPRTEMVYFDKDQAVRDCVAVFRDTKHTRYPVVDGDKDRIIGYVNFKEVIAEYVSDPVAGSKSIGHFVRPVARMIDSTPVHDLLSKMKAERTQFIALLNEYGGTAGIVTAEDIVEVIVGDLYDEFDLAEPPLVQQVGDAHYIASSKLSVSETAELLHIQMNDEDVDTLGGWLLTENYAIQPGESIEHDGYRFTVLEMEDHQIRHVEIQQLPDEDPLAEHSLSDDVALTEPHNASSFPL